MINYQVVWLYISTTQMAASTRHQILDDMIPTPNPIGAPCSKWCGAVLVSLRVWVVWCRWYGVMWLAAATPVEQCRKKSNTNTDKRVASDWSVII